MGTCCSKGEAAPEGQKDKPPDEAAVAEDGVPDSFRSLPVESHLGSQSAPRPIFRHTSDFRVGVLESKSAAVTLLNDYIVLGSLGKGTYGSVKLCYNMLDDGLYALKVLQRAQLKRQMLGARGAGGAAGEDSLGMLRREVDVMRSMNHPNLIKIFEVIEHTSKVVLVQEYAEAGPLAQPDQPMSEELARYYFRQIVAGLGCLHSQNVVHGDMKPDNVLLSGSGLVKIADFGQAQFFDQGTDVTKKTLGTPAFMAPEVRSGDAYHGMPADMWALGVTLYSFLFNDLPFKGATSDELYRAIQTQEVQYPAEVPISPALRSVLEGLFNKDPSKRPTSQQLLHHPWVAEEGEGEGGGLGSMPLDMDRKDDAPSLEHWVEEMALQPVESMSRLPMVNEVAAQVFGRDIMQYGGQAINTQALIGAITDPMGVGGSAATAPSAPLQSLASTLRSESEGVLAGGAQQAEQQAGQQAQHVPLEKALTWEEGLRGFGGLQLPLQPEASGPTLATVAEAAAGSSMLQADGKQMQQGQAAQQSSLQPPAQQPLPRQQGQQEVQDVSAELASVEGQAATLDDLLTGLNAELAAPGRKPAWLEAVGEAAAAAEAAAAEGIQQQQLQPEQQLVGLAQPGRHIQQQGPEPYQGQHTEQQHGRQAAIPRHRYQPVAAEQPMPTPLRTQASSPQRLQTSPSAAGSCALPHPRSATSMGTGLNSLPMSPFESNAASITLDVPPPSGRKSMGSLGSGSFLAAGGGFSAAGRTMAGLPPALRTGEEVWETMRRKTEVNKVPGVRFVRFSPGDTLDAPDGAIGNLCLLIEKGHMDIRYVAKLPSLPGHRDCSPNRSARIMSGLNPIAGITGIFSGNRRSNGDASGSGSSSEESDSEDEARLQRLDTLAREPEAQAVGKLRRRGVEPSESLKLTVERVLERAERILGSASSNSDTNLLVTSRGPNDFVGISPMLEPTTFGKFAERWGRSMVARTEVTGAFLTRQALELLLKHYPLAQVHLRITLSKARAEMLQLEALENIAGCMLHSGRGDVTTGSQRRQSQRRLDLFRAVSFARRLAENLTDPVAG